MSNKTCAKEDGRLRSWRTNQKLKKIFSVQVPLCNLGFFYKPKTSKKCKGYPLIESENFRKKSRIVPKKNPKGGPFGFTCCTFGSIKILWFSARIEPPLSGFRNLVEEDEQQNRWTNCKKWTIQSEIVGWKRKKTTHCNSRDFFLKGKGAD